ncbi:hypothetical protein HK102_012806, partial [Quaeritorhiza haematococci]
MLGDALDADRYIISFAFPIGGLFAYGDCPCGGGPEIGGVDVDLRGGAGIGIPPAGSVIEDAVPETVDAAVPVPVAAGTGKAFASEFPHLLQ